MTPASLLRISRPRFWIYLIGPVLIAFATANLSFSVAFILLAVYATLPANLLIYGFNDIFDRDTDKLNAKKAGYERVLDDSSILYLLLWIIVLNVPLLILLTLLLPTASLPWILVFLVAGVGYSVPPIRAKTKPFLDASFNILYVCLGFAAYVALTGQQPDWQIILAAACWCAAMHAYSAVPDIQADQGAKLHTIATVLGATFTLLLCGLLYIMSGLLSTYALGWFSYIACAIYAVMIGISFIAFNQGHLLKVYKLFPLINTAVGMGLWFFIVLS